MSRDIIVSIPSGQKKEAFEVALGKLTAKDVRSGEFCRVMGGHRFSTVGLSPLAPDFVDCIHCGTTIRQPKVIREARRIVEASR